EMESVLGAMMIRTKRNPAKQINEFRTTAGFTDDSLQPFYNRERLVADLDILKNQRVNVEVIHQIEDVVFIIDKNDTIIAPIVRKELVDVFAHRDIKYVTETKHLAPLRVPDLVVQCILGE